jgi:hypothetical protein
MIAQPKTLMALVAVIFLMSFLGCSQKEDESRENPAAESDTSSGIAVKAAQDQPVNGSTNQIAANDSSVGDLISLWDTGKEDEATEKFLSIDWQDASTFNQIRGLSMSEEDMKSLSDDEIKSIVGETMPLLGSMRKLFFHIAAEAERLAASGEVSKAQEYLTAIKEYGNNLSNSNHLSIVQKHGEAAVLYADGKLSDMQ